MATWFTTWITPDGLPGNSGTSVSTGRDLASLNAAIAEAAASTATHRYVFVRNGEYPAPSAISLASGPATGRVVVMSVDADGTPMRGKRAKITGTRPFPYRPTDPIDGSATVNGEQPFVLNTGFRNVEFRGFDVGDFGNGFFRFAAAISGLRLVGWRAHNFTRLIEGDSGVAVTGLHVEDLVATHFSRAVARIQGASSGLRFRRFRALAGDQSYGNFPAGLVFNGSGAGISDVLIEDGVIVGAQDAGVKGSSSETVVLTGTTPVTLTRRGILDNNNFTVTHAGTVVASSGGVNWTKARVGNRADSYLDDQFTLARGASSAIPDGATVTVAYDYYAGLHQDTAYAQGDGISTEESDRNFTIRRCTILGMNDRAIDNKADQVVVEDCVFAHNKRHVWNHNVLATSAPLLTSRRNLYGPATYPGGSGTTAAIGNASRGQVVSTDDRFVWTGEGSNGPGTYDPPFALDGSDPIAVTRPTIWVPGGQAALDAATPALRGGGGAGVFTITEQTVHNSDSVAAPAVPRAR